MTLEEAGVAKLQQVPENEREKLLLLIDEWIVQHRTADTRDVQQALTAVQSTWATVTLSCQHSEVDDSTTAAFDYAGTAYCLQSQSRASGIESWQCARGKGGSD